MKINTPKDATITAIILAAMMMISLPLAAAPEDSLQPAGDAAEPLADSVETAAEPARKYSEGMYIPVDGSSLEAFNDSLASIEKKAKPAEFNSLKGAIDWLLMYDLSARGNRTRLAKNLDGQTGEQIMSQVNWTGRQ